MTARAGEQRHRDAQDAEDADRTDRTDRTGRTGRTEDLWMPVIDIHAHTLTPAVFPLVAGEAGYAREQEILDRTFGAASMAHNRRLAEGPFFSLLGDIAPRLEKMDRARVDLQVVSSTPTQYHYWADEQLARRICEAINDRIVAIVAEAPDRLVGLGTVALQYPELAASQLAVAVRTLGLRGVEISTSAGGREFSDPVFEPFWSAAEELEAFVFIHPWGCSLETRLSSFYLANVIGNPTETTIALSHLVFAGVLDRHPRLRVCGAHGGGYFPFYIGRADHAWEARPDSHVCADPPSSYLRRLWFDSLVYRPDSLAQLTAVAGADHVLLGSDYPFDMGVEDPLDRLEACEALSQASRQLIAGRNAALLLGLTLGTTRNRGTT